MEKVNIKGTVEFVGETQTFGSGFTKRNLIINNGDKFAPYFEVSAKKDTCEQLDAVHVGDEVEVSIFVDGGRQMFDDKRIEGGKRAYTELTIASVMVTAKAEKPTTATSWDELLKLGEAYGEGKDDLVARCKKAGKPFKEMGEADWKQIAEDVVKAHGSTDAASEVDDDMPF